MAKHESLNALAKAVGRSVSSLNRYKAAGAPIDGPPYNDGALKRWIAKYDKSKDNTGNKSDAPLKNDRLNAAKTRRAEIEAQQRELAFQEQVGQLIRLDDAIAIAKRNAELIRRQLEALPRTLAERLAPAMTPADVQDIIDREIDTVLQVVAGAKDGKAYQRKK